MALLKYPRILRSILNRLQPLVAPLQTGKFHNSACTYAWVGEEKGPRKWLNYNNVIYPPQSPDEPPRPAFVCHQITHIKYSPWKMWYIACLVRGMPVDEAIKQLKFVPKKGATFVKQALEEAKELAVKHHNVEFPSNMWVAESMVGKGPVIKGIRRHARQRYGTVEYFHCHYFVRLEEGVPPKNYYQNTPKEPRELLEKWVQEMRNRKISNSL